MTKSQDFGLSKR